MVIEINEWTHHSLILIHNAKEIYVVMETITEIGQKISENKQRKAITKKLTQQTVRTLLNSLKDAKVEKDVENAWRKVFAQYYIDKNPDRDLYHMDSPYDTDGFISIDDSSTLVFALRLLMEFKNGTDLTVTYDRARITAQVVHYMKKFALDGKKLPTVIVGADENQAFVLLASNFYKYLKGNYNWECRPSMAYKEDTQLLIDLQDDANLSIYPFQFNKGSFKNKYESVLDLFESIEAIIQEDDQETFKIKVSPATIVGMFDEFTQIAYRKPQEIKADESVNLFFQMLLARGNEEYYFLPMNRNKFHLPGDRKIDVFGNKLDAFFNHYDRNFSPAEIDKLKAIADRLLEANVRRMKGDYWTPTIWAQQADKMLAESFGKDYKQQAIVWDCACGVRNLTRDYNYANLYLSTFHQGEVELGNGYNPEAKEVFQYDFLNDDVNLNTTTNANANEWKMPNSLFNALSEASKTGKQVIFYTNPPYGTANNVQADGSSKKGISKSAMNDLMKQQGYGKASQQLYAQFFIRILKLVKDFGLHNVGIGFFTNARFFAGGEYWEAFNKKFFAKFKFIQGNYFNAGEFSDTADTWPITFAVYKLRADECSEEKATDFQPTFSIQATSLDQQQQPIITEVGQHQTFFVSKQQSLNYWAKAGIKNLKAPEMEQPYPQLSSALSVSKGTKPRGKLVEGSLGYMVNNSNNVGEGISNGGVWVVSSSAYKANGFNVLPQNFEEACVNFTARRSVKPTWINAQDNYRYPDRSHELYPEFVNDAIIYTLFDNASYQASYRNDKWTNINVTGKWANQWYFMSRHEMTQLAEKYHNQIIYNDLRGDKDRFVYREIMARTFSKEAEAVLQSAKEVIKQTFPARGTVMDDFPELYLNAWDAGWFQIKQLNKKVPVKAFSEFQSAFKILKQKSAENVYKLGMLSK